MYEEMQQFETLVMSRRRWFDFNLREVWRYRDLILLMVKRSFTARYKQTLLGPAWAVIQPLLTTVVFTVIFGNIANLAAVGVPTFVFYMAGNIFWSYFSSCLTGTASTFTGNAALLSKVYFPRLVMPVTTVIANLIPFVIQFGMFIVFLVIYICLGQIQPTFWMLITPLALLQMALLAAGFGIIVSALTTKYRDLSYLVGFGVQLWMYASPIAYDIRIIPEALMGAYMLNPITPLIQTLRLGFLGVGSFDSLYYVLSWVVTLVVLFIGLVLFNHVEKTFTDTV